MNKLNSNIRHKDNFIVSAAMIVLSFIFTLTVAKADVEPIGPLGSEVGLASLNGKIFSIFGESSFWNHFTDLLAVIAILVALGFAAIGLMQFIQRKDIFKVNKSLIALGCLYIIMGVLYVLFELVKINYRPVLDDGELAASFPSSHTMLVCTIMGSGAIQIKKIIKNDRICRICSIVSLAIIVLMIIGRILSGAHWFTDVVGGALFGSTLVMLYYTALCELTATRSQRRVE